MDEAGLEVFERTLEEEDAANLCRKGHTVFDAASPDKDGNQETVKGTTHSAVDLNGHEVVTTRDTSYGALNSNSISRFNMELLKAPVAADIFTEQFIQDVG